MRVIVTSDTHRKWTYLHQVVQRHASAQVVIHLGDGEDDFENVRYEFPHKMMVNVAGNCDLYSSLPYFDTINVEGVRIFFTHGHIFNVKYGYDDVMREARRQNAQICLFGHTHVPYTNYVDGLYVMNPGALSGSNPSYGVIDITPSGIMTFVNNL